jgi:penicillin-binding protein 1C
VAALAATATCLAAWVRMGPLPEGFLDLGRHASTVVVDRNGVPLYESLSAEGQRSRVLAGEQLPAHLVAATLAAEDRRFFAHPGVDPVALMRATVHNLRARRLVEGGSTVTQQVVKLLMRRPRTLGGKLREILYALRLEHRLEKREILALYMALAPYGNQLVGAEAASRAYFGCAAEDLTPAQAAFLAGLPQRPGALNPHRNFAAAARRQGWVLERMARNGALDTAGLARAQAERLRLARPEGAFAAPHFVERVMGDLRARRARRVETTLDAELQRRVRGILGRHRERLRAHGAHNVAVAVLDNTRGEWLAWEGSGDWFDADHGGAIDGVVTPRQPGSALKPFTYALAFEAGFTPASVLPDVPQHFGTAREGVSYSPRNYDGRFRGPLRARQALAGSENVPAVWLLSRLGVADLLRTLRRAGLTTLERSADHYGYALTMGDAEVRLDELVAAYSALARGGRTLPPRHTRRVVWDDGTETAPGRADGVALMSPRAAFWVADILADDRARAFIFGHGGSLDFPFPVAVKTGTSQSYRDNWTIGFTREVTVGVWVGNFDRAELRNSSGVTGAAPIFHDVLQAAQERVTGRLPAETDPPLAAPTADLRPVAICALSGLAAGESCPAVETEWLPPGPRTRCNWHRHEHGRAVVHWPARYRSWAAGQGLLDEPGAPVAARAPSAAPAQRRTEPVDLRIVNPPEGAFYLRDPTLRADFQTLPLRAEADPAAGLLTWRVDGVVVGTARPEKPLDWPLTRGPHLISVSDERGRRRETRVVVR